jgi:hypothetical protein
MSIMKKIDEYGTINGYLCKNGKDHDEGSNRAWLLIFNFSPSLL